MHLNGDLSDFALADILQILSLGRKTGTLLVENGSLKGRIVIEEGRITGAEAQPGGNFADALIRRGKLKPETLAQLRRIATDCPEWNFKSLLLESGLLSESAMEKAAIMHICTLVARLVDIGKGSFRLLLNETALVNAFDNFKLAEGLDIGEVLLQSATESDEAQRLYEPAANVASGQFEQSSKKVFAVGAGQNHRNGEHHKETVRTPAPTNGAASNGAASNGNVSKYVVGNGAAETSEPNQQRIERFYALLAELSANSALMEISLLVMRYASEFAARGILFGVHEGELHGIGQFGVDRFMHSHGVDGLIRGINIPLASDALVACVARERSPYVGRLPRSYWDAEMLQAIGGGDDGLQALAVPLLRNGSVVYVIYADNFGTSDQLIALDELIALTSVATLALDKTLLQ
ncbi:MAG: hypothetical protein V7641_1891, partial [Blastocatellia bacterium]